MKFHLLNMLLRTRLVLLARLTPEELQRENGFVHIDDVIERALNPQKLKNERGYEQGTQHITGEQF